MFIKSDVAAYIAPLQLT